MVERCARRGARLLIPRKLALAALVSRGANRLIIARAVGPRLYFGFRMRTGDGRGATPYLQQPYFREMPRLLLYETAVHFLDTFRFLGGIGIDFCQTNRIQRRDPRRRITRWCRSPFRAARRG
jgi:hypothetical protein